MRQQLVLFMLAVPSSCAKSHAASPTAQAVPVAAVERLAATPAAPLQLTLGVPLLMGTHACVYATVSNLELLVDEEVSLGSSTTQLSFYTDAACSQQVTQLTIEKDVAVTPFYLFDTTPGLITVSVEDAGSLGLVGASGTVQTDTVAAIAFQPVSAAPQVGVCQPLSLATYDATGAAKAPAVPLAIAIEPHSLSTGGYGGVFYQDAACSKTYQTYLPMAAGAEAVATYFQPNTPGPVAFTVYAYPAVATSGTTAVMSVLTQVVAPAS